MPLSNGKSDFFSSSINNNNNHNHNQNQRSMINNTRNIITPPNYQQQQQQPCFQFRSPLSGLLPDQTTQIRKRTFTDFNHQQQQSQSYGFYNRNVKPRSIYQQPQNYSSSSPISTLSTPVDFSSVPTISSLASGSGNLPILQNNRPQSWLLYNQNVANNFTLPNLTQTNQQLWNNNNNNNNNNNSVAQIPVSSSGQENKTLVNQCLLDLEKQLLSDDEEIVVGESASALTESEWSETIQNLLLNSNSPTDSSTSTSASPPTCPRQSLVDAAIAISDSKPQVALEILTRLGNVANANGSPEQRLVSHMVSALKARVEANDRAYVDMLGAEHGESRRVLLDVSPCFKLGFMAANSAILEAVKEAGLNKIHVVDMDIGNGGQYVHLIHALAAAKNGTSLKISALGTNEEAVKTVRGGLQSLAQQLGVNFSFAVNDFDISLLSREKLDVQSDEALVVNFAFLLCKVPDESVTVENKRDELLRRVKGISPVVMTVVEQQVNGNTAPLITRVRDACEHYGALLESLDSFVAKDSAERVKIEEGLGRKMANSVACEGTDRVERCEVFGKWRARMSMAGFQPREMSQLAADSLRARINSGTRGNPGFTVSLEFGGICFGWKGKTITVASAWR